MNDIWFDILGLVRIAFKKAEGVAINCEITKLIKVEDF